MNTEDAQRDMRDAYFAGGPGMLASALAWAVAGGVTVHVSARAGVLALFAGGMLIHPVGVLLCRLLGRSGRHDPRNPLGPLTLENTGWLLFSLPLAFAVSLLNMGWFFPAMLLVIGGRYLTFHTVYGLRLYWVCGAVLALAAYGLAAAKAPPHLAALAGAALETVFALLLTKWKEPHP
jgi:hypothetical protein